MKRLSLILLSVLLAGNVLAQRATINDTAKFLAGMPVQGPLEPLTRDAAWLDHARNMEGAWF
jgi:hypothetical protein